jgi:hypothetical protein
MDIVCTLNESWWDNVSSWALPADPFQIRYTPVRPIPRQVGTEDIEMVTIPSAGSAQNSFLKLDGALEEFFIFYRIAGSVGHPQKVIQSISRTMRPVLRLYEVSNGWISRGEHLLRTVVRFFEIPNDVNMEILSGIDTDAQAWLPF